MRKWAVAVAAVLLPSLGYAQNDNIGTIISIEGEHRIDKKWSASMDIEMRTRNALGDVKRLSAGISLSYKICPWLKADAGYTFIGDHRRRVSHYDEGDRDVVKGLAEVGAPKNRRIFWGMRHRTHASLTATWKTGNFKLSLRERWLYRYRPEQIVEGRYNYCYDKTDNAPHHYPTKVTNMLRSRIHAEYKIDSSPATPYVSLETFNAWKLKKVRCTAGVEWKLRKGHTIDTAYRYQHPTNGKQDSHYLCLAYKFKF